ncbi:hypothetical protein A1Q1_03887 [Trichosporon asahii var. asahii CBS 2479]|uniref:Uncharacterized protein n=1 Tax=Trichosporon asahii var. asahii (strain ATCC 90039 / CBS 2479 / JCM 2466 / KCTC 7840 / NBRC 103889/ NCYC 2677 / UAMH 7654) TaxID=1186058 RepID=J5QGM9_TRIAS|nr:hypothetical protein A1Q1_03887 [Trichosporon asahii var. asahii CBS 2479]EJT47258.1 hypothetical protein A1Q1_03887 [Trichosporon asahii var. asahii CBS 2479]
MPVKLGDNQRAHDINPAKPSVGRGLVPAVPAVPAVRTGHNLSDVRHATVPISGVRMNPSSPSSNRAGSTLWPRALATRPSTLDAATSRPSPQVPIPSMLTPGTRDAHSVSRDRSENILVMSGIGN